MGEGGVQTFRPMVRHMRNISKKECLFNSSMKGFVNYTYVQGTIGIRICHDMGICGRVRFVAIPALIAVYVVN